MSCHCPACGQPLPKDTVLLDTDAGIVVANGRFAVLTRHEWAVFEALWFSRLSVVRKEQLMNALYSLTPEEDPEIKIIDVYICKLRQKLSGMGISIGTVWGTGFRITRERECA